MKDYPLQKFLKMKVVIQIHRHQNYLPKINKMIKKIMKSKLKKNKELKKKYLQLKYLL